MIYMVLLDFYLHFIRTCLKSVRLFIELYNGKTAIFVRISNFLYIDIITSAIKEY